MKQLESREKLVPSTVVTLVKLCLSHSSAERVEKIIQDNKKEINKPHLKFHCAGLLCV